MTAVQVDWLLKSSPYCKEGRKLGAHRKSEIIYRPRVKLWVVELIKRLCRRSITCSIAVSLLPHDKDASLTKAATCKAVALSSQAKPLPREVVTLSILATTLIFGATTLQICKRAQTRTKPLTLICRACRQSRRGRSLQNNLRTTTCAIRSAMST